MRFFRRSLVGLFLLALTVGLLAVAGQTLHGALEARWNETPDRGPARERVFAVNVLPVEPQEITPVLTSFGEVRSKRTLDLRAPVAGRILELSPDFQEGGVITTGQFLARIDPAEAQTALGFARTDMIEAEADLRDAQNALTLAQDELAAARAQEELQARALSRQRDLKDRGVGTEAAVEAAELALSTATQSTLSRRQALQQVQTRISQAETLIARRQINLEDAERLLADTEVYAAFTGRLSDVTATAGGLVATNERLAQLVDPSALEVSFRVSTAQYVRLLDDQGQLIDTPVAVTLDAFGLDLESEGRLVRESAAVAGGTTGRVLFAALDDPKGLRPGDFVTLTIEEPPLSEVAQVPASAVNASGTVLVVGEEDRLEEASVELLRRQGDDVLIRASGLAGREIVAERSALLGSGIKVRPLRATDVEVEVAEAPDLVELDDVRRAKLIAFVEQNERMPDDVRTRLLTRLAEPKVPIDMVQRLESRMGS